MKMDKKSRGGRPRKNKNEWMLEADKSMIGHLWKVPDDIDRPGARVSLCNRRRSVLSKLTNFTGLQAIKCKECISFERTSKERMG
jgi:hypothetical protein